MRRTQHKMIAVIPHGDPDIGAEVECEIVFSFFKGAPEQGPSYASGGQPADPDEIELVRVRPIIGGKPSEYGGAYADMEQSSLEAIAEDWLLEDGFADACEVVASDDADAREYAAELRADR
jgi:hypothetical protein